MNQKDKCLKIREIMYRANGIEEGTPNRHYTKWRNVNELEEYLSEFGGRVKNDRKRRRGYFVVHLYDSKNGRPVCAEIPKDFGEKVMVLGGFP